MTFVIICLDGFKYDYLKNTKFLKHLASKNLNGEIYHGFGYASEFSAITGKDVNELGMIVNNFYYNPNKIKFFYFWRFLDKIPFNNQSRLFLNILYNIKEFLVGNNQPKSIFNIPLKYSKYFDFLMKKNFFAGNSLSHPTIFDVLKNKKKISGYMWPFVLKNNKTKIDFLNISTNTTNTDKRAFTRSISLLKDSPDLFYLHFFSTDNLVHKYGTESKKTIELIKILDKYVEEISKYADKLLIFSDHGMTDIKEIIDIKKIIDSSGLVFGKDYVMFLDSTLARFWFFNDNAKNKIKNLLLKTKNGKIISFKNKDIHRKFGELIFQVNPGILILPNFYQNVADKATHGYDDKSPDEKAFYIFKDDKNKSGKLKKNIKMQEIFNIIIKNS